MGVFGDGSGQKRGDCVVEDPGRSGFGGPTVAGVRQGTGGGGMEVCDTAVSAPHAPAYAHAAMQPLGTATMREGSKESTDISMGSICQAGAAYIHSTGMGVLRSPGGEGD